MNNTALRESLEQTTTSDKTYPPKQRLCPGTAMGTIRRHNVIAHRAHRVAITYAAPIVAICSWIIVLVGAYDLFLTIKYFESLHALEQNPIARYLLALSDTPHVIETQAHYRNCLVPLAVFSLCKMLGTFLVIASLQALYQIRRQWVGIIAACVAAFQIYLLMNFLC